MTRIYPHVPDKASQFLHHVREGKLFQVQAWIAAGNPVRFPMTTHRNARTLKITVESGFHSMLEILLPAAIWDRRELEEALYLAIEFRRKDLVELLLGAGAKLTDTSFYHLAHLMDFSLMERFIREGGRVTGGDGFASALLAFKAKPLIRLYKTFRNDFPELEDEASVALGKAIAEDNPRLAALLVWAGADPWRIVIPREDDGDCESEKCALRELAWSKDVDSMIAALKLKPTPEQAWMLLQETAFFHNRRLTEKLLAHLTKDHLNCSPRGSCEPLESLVARGSTRGKGGGGFYDDEADEAAHQCIDLFIQAGARWNPDPQQTTDARRSLLRHPPKYLSKMVRTLLNAVPAVDPDALILLFRSSTFMAKLKVADPRICYEAKHFTRHKKIPETNPIPPQTSFSGIEARPRPAIWSKRAWS